MSQAASSKSPTHIVWPLLAAKRMAGQPWRSLMSGLCGSLSLSSRSMAQFHSHAAMKLRSAAPLGGKKSRITSCNSWPSCISSSSPSSPSLPLRIRCLNREQPTLWETYLFRPRICPPSLRIRRSESNNATSSPEAAKVKRTMRCETGHHFRRVHARAWLAHGACKFYRWERSYISLRQLPPRLLRVLLVFIYIYMYIYIYIWASETGTCCMRVQCCEPLQKWWLLYLTVSPHPANYP